LPAPDRVANRWPSPRALLALRTVSGRRCAGLRGASRSDAPGGRVDRRLCPHGLHLSLGDASGSRYLDRTIATSVLPCGCAREAQDLLRAPLLGLSKTHPSVDISSVCPLPAASRCGPALHRPERRLPLAAHGNARSASYRPQPAPVGVLHTVAMRSEALSVATRDCSACPCARHNLRQRGCQPRCTFRPCRSSRLRRIAPHRTLQVCCALLPTMGFAMFPGRHLPRPFAFRGACSRLPTQAADAGGWNLSFSHEHLSHARGDQTSTPAGRGVVPCPFTYQRLDPEAFSSRGGPDDENL